MSSKSANVRTTGGPVPADTLGVVLPHEHLLINELREDRANGLLNDIGLMEAELNQFRGAGGGALVELTTAELTYGAAPDPRGLYVGVASDGALPSGTRTANNVRAIAEMASRTGVQVILGTGHYRDPYLAGSAVERQSVYALAERMTIDILEGFPDTGGICAGVIGEVGADKWFISPLEEISLQAAALAHRATGATVTTHASKWPVGGDIVDMLISGGVSPDRIIVGHCSTIDIPEYHLDMARRGAWVQFDTLRGGPQLVVDRWIERLMALIKAGYIDQILLSHDVCLKDHLSISGGCGFTYVMKDFLPRLIAAGLEPAEAHRLITDNPQRALAF